MIASILRKGLGREAAADGSQGQVPIQIGTSPLDRSHDRVLRPEGAPEYRTIPLFLRTPSGRAKTTRSVLRGGVPTGRDLPLATFFHAFGVVMFSSITLLISTVTVSPQERTYPKEIRGYKVERAAVEMKSTAQKKAPAKSEKEPKPNPGNDANTSTGSSATNNTSAAATPTNADVDQLIKFGSPSLARITPLGITFNVPVVVSPIKQSGHVDFLLFEDMAVNDHSVEIDEYKRGFDLPTKKPLTLREPLRFYIYLPVAALAAVGEWNNSKEHWPITGRVYVCGKYKKFLFNFKRCVPVELNLLMRNPLRS